MNIQHEITGQVTQALQPRSDQISQEVPAVHLSDQDKTLETPIVLQKLDHLDLMNYLAKIEHHLFQNSTDKVALVYGENSISYRELGQHVAKLMTAFNKAGLKQGDVVAICVGKRPEHVYTVLACALSGIIWLPVDMESPQARLEYLLKNSCANVAITQTAIAGIKNLDILEILSQPISQVVPDFNYQIDRNPAYYLYTSGSTGTPKCVVLNNQATANVLQQTILNWQITAQDVFMAATPFHHDMSVFDILAPLTVGATLVIPTPDEVKSAVAWANLIDQHRISIWCTVPAIVDMLLSCATMLQIRSLRLVAQGGDYIKPSLIQKLRKMLPHARLISLGGPTETTIWSIWHEIGIQDQEIIPYGQAIENNEYYILDDDNRHCAVKQIGRICMAGVNLSNGYLLNGQLNQRDFIQLKIPSGETQLALKMSDQGYFREDGKIIFAGREEGYLKIRGVRISAAEVENALCKHEKIHDCVVVNCINPVYDGNELVAIYSVIHHQDEQPDISTLRSFLQIYLPNSHIPTRWLLIDKLPLTRNGKIDRKSLQKMAQEQLDQNYATRSAEKNIVTGNNVNEMVLDLLRQYKSSPSDIFYDTDIIAAGIRPVHLNKVAKHFSNQFKTNIDFYSLVRCRTVQEVIDQIQQKINQ
ncbi:Anguibactin system regulator [Acinetobacter stercoris]|uniref:Anguibactin system regulator n=2 Tax=Acinetobacter stercoris TaxID=2126983 RepID=A0A2U3MZ46_9GAMM|nr:Anguibactin system regulator [Acinetobacter stercoris]